MGVSRFSAFPRGGRVSQYLYPYNPWTLASSVADLRLRALKARILVKGRETGLGLNPLKEKKGMYRGASVQIYGNCGDLPRVKVELPIMYHHTFGHWKPNFPFLFSHISLWSIAGSVPVVKQTLASGTRGVLSAHSALTAAQRNKLKEAGGGTFR